LQFPSGDEDAAARFESYKKNDPFVDVIPPALLNSSDIYDYVRVTGMIHPFEHDEKTLEKKLKGASYEIDFLGEVWWSDENDRTQIQLIEKNAVFRLRKNSIAFVYLKTQFRLPHYIAVRFILKITHVHRGLLLGTGPLVDPGFSGRLLIPLHNLTAEDYVFIGGEGFIWAEFTKLAPYIENNPNIRASARRPFLFPDSKKDLGAQAYFNKASSGIPARSSIPDEVREAKRIAQATERKVDRYTFGAIVTAALTVFGLVGGTWSLISDANKNMYDSSKNVTDSRKAIEDVGKELEKLRGKVERIEKDVAAVEKPSAPKPKPPGEKK
jgi:deoxycytidine triphosphate deaminase